MESSVCTLPFTPPIATMVTDVCVYKHTFWVTCSICIWLNEFQIIIINSFKPTVFSCWNTRCVICYYENMDILWKKQNSYYTNKEKEKEKMF